MNTTVSPVSRVFFFFKQKKTLEPKGLRCAQKLRPTQNFDTTHQSHQKHSVVQRRSSYPPTSPSHYRFDAHTLASLRSPKKGGSRKPVLFRIRMRFSLKLAHTTRKVVNTSAPPRLPAVAVVVLPLTSTALYWAQAQDPTLGAAVRWGGGYSPEGGHAPRLNPPSNTARGGR